MMSTPSERPAPDSVFPLSPDIEARLRHLPNEFVDLSVVANGFVERWLQDFVLKNKEDLGVVLKFEKLSDDLRAQIIRALRSKFVRGGCEIKIGNMKYSVELTDCHRSGFIITHKGGTPIEPMSTL
jgi:hypothetical protein